MSHHLAILVAAILCGFIAGVAGTAVVMWFRRDKIKAKMARRRGGP